jgi:hypothetical protein
LIYGAAFIFLPKLTKETMMQPFSSTEKPMLPNNMSPPGPDIYSESAVWLCENRKTRFKTRIHGALAQILKQYPNDYKLKLLKMKEPRHEHLAATDQ